MTRDLRPTFAVVDGRKFLGMIPASKIAEAAGTGGASRSLTAKELLTPDVKVAYLEDDLYSTLELFRRSTLEVVPVVEEGSGDYAGMLCRSAILQTLRRRLADQRHHLLREHSGLSALAQESLLENLLSDFSSHAVGNVHRMMVPDEVAGKSLKECAFRTRYESHVLAIQRSTGELITSPDPDHVLLRKDTLIVFRDGSNGTPQ